MNRMKSIPSFIFNPWVYFLLFGATLALLSFGPFSLPAKTGIGFLGLVLPFLAALILCPSGQTLEISNRREWLPSAPVWFWILLGGVAVLLRFFDLTTFAAWPHYDEGLTSYYVLDLCRHWQWKLFFGNNQTPPLFLWGLALVYKVGGASLFSLWFYPAVISLLTVPLGYFAARSFFPRSFSLTLACLLSVGFWPVFIGRFSIPAVLVVWGECGVLALLGWSFRSFPADRNKRLLLLGLGVGLGFYIFISWPVVALMLGIGVAGLGQSIRHPREFAKSMVFFGAPCLLVITPLIWEAIRLGYGDDLTNLAAFGHSIPLSEQFQVSFSYLTSLFWGLDPQYHTYQPVWGGYLNPLLGALFLLGALEIIQNRDKGIYQWLALAFLVFLLPGIFTRERETFRIVTILPILFTITTLGMVRLLATASVKKNAWLLSLFLISSAGLDICHLDKYHHLWDRADNWKGYAKSLERSRAYGILEKVSEEEGTGGVFSDFTPGLSDQTLSLADYRFNGVENPALPWENTRWAAVLTNVNERPFLERRFGPGRAYALSREELPADGGWMLWIIPLNETNRPVFGRWVQANQALRPFTETLLTHLQGQSYEKSLATLADALPSFGRDPFLLSFYWEKRADLLMETGNLSGAEESLQQAVIQGEPSADLYYRLGVVELILKKTKTAQGAFQSALRAPLNITNSSQALISK